MRRFVRDFLQKSSGNTHRSTHITQPCQSVSRVQPLQTTPAHTPIPIGQRHSPTTTHNLTIPCACHESFRVHTSKTRKVLRLPRNVTSVTPRNLTIPCAPRKSHSMPQNPRKVLRLPRKVTMSSHVSFTKFAPHHTFGMIFHPF